MTYRILFTFLIAAASYSSFAQSRFNLVIETGHEIYSCGDDLPEYLRASPEPYYYSYYDYNPSSMRARMARTHAAIKIEKFISPKFSLSSGVRYMFLNSYLEKDQSPEYFYLRFRQMGTTTEYLRVNDLRQESSSIGIPLEIRFAPFSGKRVNLFWAIGGDVDCRMSSKNYATFEDPTMNEFQSGVSDIVGDPDAVFTSAYGRFGAVFGRKHPVASVSITLPAFLPDGASTLVRPEWGAGFNLQFIKTF